MSKLMIAKILFDSSEGASSAADGSSSEASAVDLYSGPSDERRAVCSEGVPAVLDEADEEWKPDGCSDEA